MNYDVRMEFSTRTFGGFKLGTVAPDMRMHVCDGLGQIELNELIT